MSCRLPASLLVIAFALSATARAQSADDFDGQGYFNPASQEVCAATEAEVGRSAELSAAVDTFGGYANMFLGWRLAGLAGVFAKTHVTLASGSSGFVVKINSDEEKAVSFCFDPQAPDVLKLRIHKAKNPEFGLFLLKPGEIGQSIYAACSKSGWKFMKFKRL